MKFQIKPNLILDGKKIISYTTIIGKVEDNFIVSYGKFSRTSGKHISHIAHLFNKPVKEVPRKIEFYKFEQGVRNIHDDAISMGVSNLYLKAMGEGKSPIEAILKIPHIPKRDWEEFKKILKIKGDCDPPCKPKIVWWKIK